MAKEPDFLSWEDRFSVGIPLVDSQHKKLFEVTNELYDACRLNNNFAKMQFKQTVREAVAYVKYHFSAEEQIMKRTSYPEYPVHKKAHEDFVMEIIKNAEDFETGKKFVPHNFVRFLKDWILSHVALTDSKVGYYIVELQKSGKLGKIILEEAKPEAQLRASGVR